MNTTIDTVFLDMTPRIVVDRYQRPEGTSCLRLQDRRKAVLACRRSTFLRNGGNDPSENTVSNIRRRPSSVKSYLPSGRGTDHRTKQRPLSLWYRKKEPTLPERRLTHEASATSMQIRIYRENGEATRYARYT